MADTKFRIRNAVTIGLFLLSCVDCSKLNVPRVLLPVFNDFATTFTLEATEGGCYKWSTTREDIIQISLVNEDPELFCSTKAVISTVSKEAARNIAVVLAEDVHSQFLLRCDVIIDVIHSLTLSTTTRELFMEEAPEDFEVIAHDDQGNEFSSLEGIEFEWTVVSTGPNKDSVLRYMPFKDSPYESPPAIAALENQNKKGYRILLEGVKSGSAKVAVRLPYPEYKHVEPIETQLVVVANLLLSPGEVYIMPGDVATFKIFFINNGRMEEVALPDAQYYIEAEDQDIASSVKKSGSVTGLKEGQTRIVLRDRYVDKDDPVLKLPAATIHVVIPDYLVINVMPYKNWAILAGEEHDIVVDVYSSDNHKLQIGSGVQIFMEVGFDFHVTSRTSNGSWLTGYGIKPSLVPVEATLNSVYNEYVGKKTFDKLITTKGDLLIYPRISITPTEVILPWDPLTRPKYDIDLVATGGDGKFLWSSSNNSIGMVSQTGRVHTTSDGFFEVSAAMMRNHHNRQTAKFILMPPSHLEIIEFVMEAEVGAAVYLHIALYAEQIAKDGGVMLLPFTKCQNLPFQVKLSDNRFRQNRTAVLPPLGVSCGNIAMVGLNVGTSKVTITYYHDGKALEDSTSISAYQPLALHEPTKEIVLAVGSSINLVYTGGPRPLLGHISDHKKVVVSEHADIAQATDTTHLHSLPRDDYTVIEVLCKKLGEADIKLMVSNTPDSPNCKSESGIITTRVTCGKPRKITLQPDLQIADSESCPMDLASGSVVVQGSQDINLEVAVYDDCGSRFLNISSLKLRWEMEPKKSAELFALDGVYPKNKTVGNVHIANKYYQKLKPIITTGHIELNVTIVGYNMKMLKKNGIKPEAPLFKGQEDADTVLPAITTGIVLYLVNGTTLSETDVTLFNHPGNRRLISIDQGSGYFEIGLTNEGVALVKYLEPTRKIEIIPMKTGEMAIQVTDLCLPSKPVIINLNVVSIGIIRVEMTDKVEIGKCIPCIVRLYDENDNIMTIPDPNMVDVWPQFEDNIANIHRLEKDKNMKWGEGEIHFVVTGVELGDTRAVFKSVSGDEDILSGPLDLQVFMPLRLNPRNGTILIDSYFQFNMKGGPHPDVIMMFHAENDKIVQIDDKGILKGMALGTSKILAKATGIHPTTGQVVIYSEDTVEITVEELKGVKIAAPLTRFKVGAIVPFWCIGLPNISPMILGTIVPSVHFKWRVDDYILVDLNNVFQLVGVEYKRGHKMTTRATGLQPGKTRLTLNVTVSGRVVNKANINTLTLSTFVDIEVFSDFYLTLPKDSPNSRLLMAPFSYIQLESNLDFTSYKVVYSLSGAIPSTEVLADAASTDPVESVVTLSKSGLLKSYATLGTALIIITCSDEYGLKQKLLVGVEVKTIHYMNLNIMSNWRIHSGSIIDFVPLGTEFNLQASFHDNVGNKFDAGPRELKIRTSRCDLTKAIETSDPATVLMQMKKPGITVIKAWAEGHQNTVNYVKFAVAQSVKPILEHLTSGDIICLWTPMVTEYNVPGYWRSNDNTLVMINPALDIGFVGNREGLVVLTYSLLPASPLHIPVLPVSEIEFLPEGYDVLTNGEVNSIVRYVLVLHSDKSAGIKTNNLIQGWRCRTDVRKLVRPRGFHCFFEFENPNVTYPLSQLFNITTSWVPESGQYACKLINIGVNGSDISLLESNISIWATTEDGDVVSPKLVVKFLPGFYVPPEIYLEDFSNSADLIVTGLHEVLEQTMVEPADSSIIFVEKGSHVENHTRHYKVRLVDYHWRLANLEDAMGILVSSRITQQNIKVMVRVSGTLQKKICGMAPSPVLQFLQTYKYAILMCTAMLVIFLLTFYFYSNYMQPVVQVNVTPGRSFLGTPAGLHAGQRSILASSGLHSSTPTTATNVSHRAHSPTCGGNCACTACLNREPVYGDASSFYSSPNVRNYRRNM